MSSNTEYLDKLIDSKDDIEQSLRSKGVEVERPLKFSAVAEYIDSIDGGGSGAKIIITAPEYEGETLTARLGDNEITAVVQDGQAVFVVGVEGTWTVSAEDGRSVEVEIILNAERTLNKIPIYGYEVNPNESDPDKRVTYTDDAVGFNPARMNYETGQFEYGDWADKWFIENNHVYALNSGGIIYKQVKDDDYSHYIDGTSTDYTSSSSPYSFMTSFPLCWIHRSQKEDGTRVVKIANEKVDDTYHAYGWEDEQGNVQDYFYISPFEASSVSVKLRTIGGVNPAVIRDISALNTHTQNNGTGWEGLDFCKWQAVIDLCVLITKSTNSQDVFGVGYSENPSTSGREILKTGSLYNKGRFWGDQTGQQAVKVFHVENAWGNTSKYCLGVVYSKEGFWRIKTRPPYTINGNDYEIIDGVTLGSRSYAGYIENGVMTKYGFIANQAQTGTGSSSTYECDYAYLHAINFNSDSFYGRFIGRGKNGGGQEGLFCFEQRIAMESGISDMYSMLTYTPQGETDNPPA